MTVSEKGLPRRAVLTRMARGALLAAAPAPLALKALAQPVPVRRSIGAMPANDPALVTFRAGVRLLKTKPGLGPRSWARLAAIHGTSAGFNKCPHGNWYFLPWHRGYLLTYERMIRWVTGDATFAMPYWDWSHDRGLPQAFAAPTVGGQPNPLFMPGRTLTPTSQIPDQVVGPAVMNAIANTIPFELFGSSRPQGQNSASVSWVSGSGVQGPLENNPHNQVHGRVGGIMASAASPLDPVFFTHHCNIDRLWAVWNSRGGANPAPAMWRDTPFTGHFVTTAGAAWSPTVKSMLSLAPLGYRYPGVAALEEPLPSGKAASARLSAVLNILQGGEGAALAEPVTPQAAAAAGVLGTQRVDRSAAPGQPVTARLSVNAERLGAATGASSGLSEEGPTQALAFLREIIPPVTGDIEVRVFLNLPEATEQTPTTVAGFVGAFGFFGGQHQHAHGPAGKSLALDLTEALRKLQAAGQPPRADLTLKFVPVGLPGVEAGHEFRIGQVDIAVI
jgi:tyrosinase